MHEVCCCHETHQARQQPSTQTGIVLADQIASVTGCLSPFRLTSPFNGMPLIACRTSAARSMQQLLAYTMKPLITLSLALQVVQGSAHGCHAPAVHTPSLEGCACAASSSPHQHRPVPELLWKPSLWSPVLPGLHHAPPRQVPWPP